MQIYSNDGQKFDSVEECLKYEREIELENEKKAIYDGIGVKFYYATVQGADRDTYRTYKYVLIVHSKGHHDLIAKFIMTELFGNQSGVRNGDLSSSSFYERWNLKLMSKEESLIDGKHALDAGEALIFEADDVVKVFDYTLPDDTLHVIRSPKESRVTSMSDMFLQELRKLYGYPRL